MKIIDNIKVKFKTNEEKINFSLSPEIQSYYDSIKPEFYDAIIKSSKTQQEKQLYHLHYLTKFQKT